MSITHTIGHLSQIRLDPHDDGWADLHLGGVCLLIPQDTLARLRSALAPPTDYVSAEKRIGQHLMDAAVHISEGRFSLAGYRFVMAAQIALDTPDTDPIGGDDDDDSAF